MKRLFLLSLVSFAFFFADGQALLLQRPVKGDVWPAFSVQRIQWQFANVDNIKIEVSADSGRNWSVMQSSYPASATFYNWTVIDKPSDSCFIRISDVANPSVRSSNYPNNPFRIPKPTLSIDAVDTSVFGKTALPISWSSTGTQNISLFITYDNFITYQLIAYNVPAVRGFYNWIAKDTVASNCFIIIQSVSNPSLIDTIEQSFSIKQLPTAAAAKYQGGSYDGHSSATNMSKNLRLLSPNGSQQLTANTIYPIRWNLTSINQVNISYSIDSGATWVNIASALPAQLGTYNWTVPATPSAKCLVRVADASDFAVYDISDAVFTIGSNLIEFTTPAENEVVYKGQALPISWQSIGISKVNISYFDGSVWQTIANGFSAANEVFNWAVPPGIPDSIKLKIVDNDNSLMLDTISNIFAKATPSTSAEKYKGGSYDGHSSGTNKRTSITLVTPNGNIDVASSLQYTITWSSSGVSNIDLAFSSDSGYTWQNIVTSYTNSERYLWNVPEIASRRCLIRISSSSDTTISDISDAVFTILPKLVDLVLDIQTTRYFGTAMPLEWTQEGIEKVSFNYKTTRNGSWKKIKDSVSSTLETYNWVLPALPGDSLWIRIFDYKDSAVNDEQLLTGVFKSLPGVSATKYRGGSFDGHAFRSTNNKINIYKPAAKDTLTSGDTYAISWIAGNVTDSITLQYSLDSGRTWVNIANSLAISGEYIWTVPSDNSRRNSTDVSNRTNENILSDECIVRAIEMNSGNEIVGISNQTFSIVQSDPLPVTIISFTGKLEGAKASLKWIVENEMNLNHYEVERSFDGTSFKKAGEVKATNARTYNFIDASEDITGQRMYYRLKKIDNDGKFDYSAIVTLQLPGNTRFTVYPNPAKTYIQIQMSHSVYGLVYVQVADVSGKIVQQKSVEASGSNVSLYSGNLTNGTYIIRIKYKGIEHVQKIVIIK